MLKKKVMYTCIRLFNVFRNRNRNLCENRNENFVAKVILHCNLFTRCKG